MQNWRGVFVLIVLYVFITLLYLGSHYESKSMPKSVKLKLKGGGFVDPETGLEDKASVHKVGENMYSIVLGNVNIQDGKNSYYKMQVLKHDKKNK